MKNLLFLEWVCVRVDLWHLKNCQKIGSVYFSNFQKIVLFKRSVYRVRVSVGPCIFLIPNDTYTISKALQVLYILGEFYKTAKIQFEWIVRRWSKRVGYSFWKTGKGNMTTSRRRWNVVKHMVFFWPKIVELRNKEDTAFISSRWQKFYEDWYSVLSSSG